jgi:mannose-6-phosphate isomerase-like protein (cupin superfamily)
MRIEHADSLSPKGWYLGPWNSDLKVSVGYANEAIDEPHLHTNTIEIYLVAFGHAQVRIEQMTFALSPGDILVLDPGEAHTFLSSSPDYFHFVIHTPVPLSNTETPDKTLVPRDRLGL